MNFIRSQAWNLFYHLEAQNLTQREREWVTSLLSQHAQSHLSQHEGDLILEPLLPLDWGNNSDAFLDVPLIDSTEGPVSLRQLSEAQGTESVYSVEDYEDNDALVTLEARFGIGHLQAPGHQRPILIFTGSIQGGRPRLHHQSEWPHGRVGTVLFWLSAQREPNQPPEGWKRLPMKVAHLGAPYQPATTGSWITVNGCPHWSRRWLHERMLFLRTLLKWACVYSGFVVPSEWRSWDWAPSPENCISKTPVPLKKCG